jgi:hypothetical protein
MRHRTADLDDALPNEKYAKIRKEQTKSLQLLLVAVLVVCALCGVVVSLQMQRTKSEAVTAAFIERAGKHPQQAQLPAESAQQGLAVPSTYTEDYYEKEVQKLDAEVRRIKAAVKIFETNDEGLAAALKLQEATRKLLAIRYGETTDSQPYRVRVHLEFQESIPDFAENGPSGSFLIEMAPVKLVPHSVFTFLEVARNYKGGAFHRVAGHVLQVKVQAPGIQHLAFQEYTPQFPHKKGTVGYAGRPSGPAWYVSIQDNSRNHGPGSQQKQNPYEADSCFGTIIEGFEEVVLKRVRLMPGNGFVNDSAKHVKIPKLEILIPSDNGEYIPWTPKSSS